MGQQYNLFASEKGRAEWLALFQHHTQAYLDLKQLVSSLQLLLDHFSPIGVGFCFGHSLNPH